MIISIFLSYEIKRFDESECWGLCESHLFVLFKQREKLLNVTLLLNSKVRAEMQAFLSETSKSFHHELFSTGGGGWEMEGGCKLEARHPTW